MKKTTMTPWILLSALSIAILCNISVLQASQEIVIKPDSQKHIALTIYNGDLAMVRDMREVELPKGEISLAYSGISARIKPETALFTSNGLRILEQNFEFDLLTPDSLLRKFTGHKVEVIKKHPTTGEESSVPAIVLSANHGVVLKMGHRIETGIPGRLAFPDVPENLRVRPTLCLLAQSKNAGKRNVELTYLTTGLSWHADYVAELNNAENSMDISGWVTLVNKSGTSYKNAQLQLVAGNVHQIFPPSQSRNAYKTAMVSAAHQDSMAEESLLDYHLYGLSRNTNIHDSQSKQVSLFKAKAVTCEKVYIVTGEASMFTRNNGHIARKLKVGVFLCTSNTKENNLGIPIPAGIVRAYKKDSSDALQFVGEDRINHTPEKEYIRLRLGDAFDVIAWKKQLDFRKVSGFSGYNYIYEAGFEITLKNALDREVTVQVRESIPGDWTITSESHTHTKKSAHIACWDVKVPAKGNSILRYRTNIKF